MKNTDKRENCIVKKLRSRGGETLAEMLVAVLIIALGMGASDVHIVSGICPKCRVDGRLVDLFPDIVGHDECEALAKELAGRYYGDIDEIGELDLAKTIAGERVRINLFRQQGEVSAALRILSNSIPKLATLGLPPVVSQFSSWPFGLRP